VGGATRGASPAQRVLTPHRRRLLTNRSTYKNLAIDAVWTLRGGAYRRLPPTWPLDPARLAAVTVRWPASYLSRSFGLQGEADSRIAERLASLRVAMATRVRTEVVDIPQPYASIVVLNVIIDGTKHEVAIDPDPRLEIFPECADRCLLYFKRHFRNEGYPQGNVVPGGFAPLKHHALERHVDRLRRGGRKTHDVFSRFSPHLAPEVRAEVLRRLSEQTRFGFEGGTSLTMYTEYLRDIAQSRICIDVPGEGPLSFRLVEYLAVGSCIVGYPHKARLHVPLVDREHIVYTREDLSDLVELCARYLEDPAERARLTRNTRDYYDRYLHRDQLGAYYLHSLLERNDR
jgi:hypothetical protein